MATFTPNKSYPQPVVNADANQWGTELNQGTTILDNNMGGVTTVSLAGGLNVTASAAQAQNLIQNLTGAITANLQYILPALGSFYFIENNTTGAFTVTVLTSAGGSVGVVVPQGAPMWVVSDGVNIYPAQPRGWQQITTYTQAAANALVLTLPPGFRRYRFTGQNVTVAVAGTQLLMTFSTNGGSTFLSTNYAWMDTAINTAGTSLVGGAGPTSNIQMTNLLSAPGACDFTYDMYPGIAGNYATVRGSVIDFVSTTSLWTSNFISGSCQTTAGPVNAVQIAGSGGVWSGTVILEGFP